MRARKSLAVIACCFLALAAGAQDLHFSQWFNSPLTTNPANTGFIPDADYRIGANYRNQYSTIMTVPYKTMSIFADAQVMRNKITNGWLGVGGVILRDVAGAGKLTSTKIYASAAYHQMLGVASLLTAGFNAGYVSKRINDADLKFPDQFDGKFFDSNLRTVVLDNPNVNYFDMQVGVNYAYFPTDNIYVNAGASIHHLNRPRESFFTSDVQGEDNRVPPRYIAFANASIKLNEMVIVNPMAYYTRQSSASELVGGATLQYNLSGDGETQLVGGLFVRPGDAFVPMVGFIWKNVRLTFSYDATSSSLKSATGGRGAYEFSIIQHGLYPENVGDVRQVLCPTFRN